MFTTSVSATVLARWPLLQGLRVLWARFWFKRNITLSRRLLEEDIKYAELEALHFKVNKKGKDVLVEKGNWPIKGVILRRFSSDYEVFVQTFGRNELHGLFAMIGDDENIVTILDAGANIGTTAINFHLAYPQARIICIEPDKSNFAELEKNLNLNNVNAIILNKALWSENGWLYFNRQFGDRREWAVAVTDIPNAGESIEACSVNDIIEQHSLQSIDLLKIDVEGSEKEIFLSGSNVSFLDITRYIAIEVHEEIVKQADIARRLVEKGFELSQSGEYLIGRNIRLTTSGTDQ